MTKKLKLEYTLIKKLIVLVWIGEQDVKIWVQLVNIYIIYYIKC